MQINNVKGRAIMTTIQYREIVYDGYQDAEIVDENLNLDLKRFAQACGQSLIGFCNCLNMKFYLHVLKIVFVILWRGYFTCSQSLSSTT